jgi:Rrf2 family nitric oxide-sensitive transcriptional repressor
MQLNRQTDYALRALIFLAMKNGLSTIDDLANKFSIAREHLTKIISRLAKLNYIVAVRGKGGGLKLNPQTLKVSLAEVVQYFEPTFKVIDCTALACPLDNMCRLSKVLGEASANFVKSLSQYTLSDILPQAADETLLVKKQLKIQKKVSK